MMSDENILAAIASLRTDIDNRLTAMTARMDHIQNDMMVRINGQFDRILDSLAAIRQDGDTTKGHVIYALQETLTLSQRISKLEEDMRRPPPAE